MRMPPRPLTLRGRLIAALLVFSAVGLAMFAGASELLLRHSLLNRADEQLHHFPLHRIAAAERPNPQRLPSDYRLTVLSPDGTTAYELGQQPGQLGGPALPALDLATVRRRGGTPFTVSDRAGGSAWRVEAVELPHNGIVAVALSLGSVDVILRQLLIIEAIVGGIVLFLVRLAVGAQRHRAVTGDAGMLDEVGRALTSFERGSVGQVQAHGEIWTAKADVPIHAGDPVRVVAVKGLMLTVDPEPTAKASGSATLS